MPDVATQTSKVGRLKQFRDTPSVPEKQPMTLIDPATISRQEIKVPVNGQQLEGILALPPNAGGLIIFAHGSGSSRFSPRNNVVADQLNRYQLATLLLDLLTPWEDESYATRFDIPLLAQRLLKATQWARQFSATRSLPIGYFGASTGAAAAMKAAAALGPQVKALVSRGGRPDLASPRDINLVRCPTLLIVGELDNEVLRLNRHVARTMGDRAKVVVVGGATHLFEEPGTLEQVAQLSIQWFVKTLAPTDTALLQTASSSS